MESERPNRLESVYLRAINNRRFRFPVTEGVWINLIQVCEFTAAPWREIDFSRCPKINSVCELAKREENVGTDAPQWKLNT